MGQKIYGHGGTCVDLDKLRASRQSHRRDYRQGQTHFDNRLQRAPSGILNCRDKGYCMRDQLGIKSGTCAEKCYAVHAEQNAITQAARLGVSVDGATLYCTHQPCTICTRIIINSGIKRVVYKNPYPDEFSMQLFDEAGIIVEKFEE